MNNYILVPFNYSKVLSQPIRSENEINNFLSWFIQFKNERTNYLLDLVFASNQDKFTFIKLKSLQYFLKDNIHVRNLTNKELATIRSQLPAEIKSIHLIPDYEFLEPTLSYIFDVSIYIGEYLINQFNFLNWGIDLDPMSIDYGLPIIIKKSQSKGGICPLRSVTIIANKIYQNEATEESLVNWFEIIQNNFKGSGKNYMQIINSWIKR